MTIGHLGSNRNEKRRYKSNTSPDDRSTSHYQGPGGGSINRHLGVSAINVSSLSRVSGIVGVKPRLARIEEPKKCVRDKQVDRVTKTTWSVTKKETRGLRGKIYK